MLRTLLGLLAFNGLAVVLGLGLLCASGLVRPRPVSLLPAVGAALVVGVAAIGTLTVAALAAGLHPENPRDRGGRARGRRALVRGGCAARAPRGPPAPEPVGRPDVRLWAPVAAVVVFVLAQVVAVRNIGVAWDAAHIWTV